MDIRRMFTYDYNSQSDSGAKLCDVAYWDGSSVKTIDIDNWNVSLGTPIGVVVIPSNFLPDGMARIVSLYGVDSNGNATSSPTIGYITFGPVDTNPTWPYYTRVPIFKTNQEGDSDGENGYLPSDNNEGVDSIVDPIASYAYFPYIPSPYSNGMLNPDYSRIISGNNVLGDFNGLSNTKLLLAASPNYQAANIAAKYNDGVSTIQWYLPASGEFGFIIARFKAINTVISQLGGVIINEWACFWCSSKYNKNRAFTAWPDGNISTSSELPSMMVRPIACLS